MSGLNKKSSIIQGIRVEGYQAFGNVAGKAGVTTSARRKNKATQMAIDAFNKYSKHGYDKMLIELKKSNPKPDSVALDKLRTLASENTTYFLYGVEIITNHEGSYDAINTYAEDGLAVGMFQFANPSKDSPCLVFLKELDTGNTVYSTVESGYQYGHGKQYIDTKSLDTRLNITMLQKLYKLLGTDRSIELQYKVVLDKFYDRAFDKFLAVVKPRLYVGPGEGPLFVWANGFCFDCAIQRPTILYGTGTNPPDVSVANMDDFVRISGNRPTEGHFCYYFANKYVKLNDVNRDNEWNGTNSTGPLMTNFKMNP